MAISKITTASIEDGTITADDFAVGAVQADKIEEGNSSVEVVDTGTGSVRVTVDGSERARFDANGVLQIGTSSGSLVSGNGVIIADSTAARLKLCDSDFGVGASDGFELLHSGADAYIIQRENAPLIFYTNGSEAARIDASANLQINSGYGSVATAYGCRAWVNFNGTGTVAIRDSGNVSSITDNGTGNYTVNFTTAMPDNEYAPVSDVVRDYDQDVNNGYSNIGTVTTTTFKILTGQSSVGNSVDWEGVFAMVVR